MQPGLGEPETKPGKGKADRRENTKDIEKTAGRENQIMDHSSTQRQVFDLNPRTLHRLLRLSNVRVEAALASSPRALR